MQVRSRARYRHRRRRRYSVVLMSLLCVCLFARTKLKKFFVYGTQTPVSEWQQGQARLDAVSRKARTQSKQGAITGLTNTTDDDEGAESAVLFVDGGGGAGAVARASLRSQGAPRSARMLVPPRGDRPIRALLIVC
jgi:hypothetical protein